MENPVQALREKLGLNQHQFADLIGRSYGSVQGYEAGKRVPPVIVERLKTIAGEKGLADVAVSLSNDDWQIKKIYYPSGHIVHPGNQQVANTGVGIESDDREAWHRALDLVWDSGKPEAVGAVKQVLLLAQSSLVVSATGTEHASKKHRRQSA